MTENLDIFYDKSIFDMWVAYRGLFCDRNVQRKMF